MAAKIIVNFGDFFLPQKSLKMRDVLEKMRECGKLPNLRDFPHDCGMVDTYVKHALLIITCLTLIVTAIYNTNWAYIISAKNIIVTNHDNYVMTNYVGWNNPRNHILGL